MDKETCERCGSLGCELPKNATALDRNFSREEAAHLLKGHQERRRSYGCVNVDAGFEELLSKFKNQTSE